MNNFEILAEVTLEKVKSFGIKSKTVIKGFKRSCRLINEFLLENEIEFAIKSANKWLLKFEEQRTGTRSQHNLFLSHRRTVLLLLDCKKCNLDEWKTYPTVITKQPENEEYIKLLKMYKLYLRHDNMSDSTVMSALRVASMFFLYLEKDKIKSINNLTLEIVSGFFRVPEFSERKPTGVQAYAYKLKKLILFFEEKKLVTNKNLHLAVPKSFSKQVKIVTTLSEKARNHLISASLKPERLSKRNHAMILLALNLGLRRSDIVNLKLKDIDWKNDSITFVQQKIDYSLF